jgi:hypothetical protein
VCKKSFCRDCCSKHHNFPTQNIFPESRLCVACLGECRKKDAMASALPSNADMPDKTGIDKLLEELIEERQIKASARDAMRALPTAQKWMLVQAQRQEASARAIDAKKDDPNHWADVVSSASLSQADLERLRHVIGSQTKTWMAQFLHAGGLGSLLEATQLPGRSPAFVALALRCVVASLYTEVGLRNLLQLPAAVDPLVTLIATGCDETRELVLSILSFIATADLATGFPLVYSALTDPARGRVPFRFLVSMLSDPSLAPHVKRELLVLVNALINAPDLLEDRIHTRETLASAGLPAALEALKDYLYDHFAAAGAGAGTGVGGSASLAPSQLSSVPTLSLDASTDAGTAPGAPDTASGISASGFGPASPARRPASRSILPPIAGTPQQQSASLSAATAASPPSPTARPAADTGSAPGTPLVAPAHAPAPSLSILSTPAMTVSQSHVSGGAIVAPGSVAAAAATVAAAKGASTRDNVFAEIQVQIDLYETAAAEDKVEASRGGIDYSDIASLQSFLREHIAPRFGQYLLPLLQLLAAAPTDPAQGEEVWSSLLALVRRVLAPNAADSGLDGDNEPLTLDRLFALADAAAGRAASATSATTAVAAAETLAEEQRQRAHQAAMKLATAEDEVRALKEQAEKSKREHSDSRQELQKLQAELAAAKAAAAAAPVVAAAAAAAAPAAGGAGVPPPPSGLFGALGIAPVAAAAPAAGAGVPPPPAGLFGAAGIPPPPAGLFGAAAPAAAAGGVPPPPAGLFGAAGVPPPPAGLFGAAGVPPPPAGLFGAAGVPPPPAGLFGGSDGGVPPPPAGLFGGGGGGVPAPPAGLFGGGGGVPAAPAGLFGGAPPGPPAGLFAAMSAAPVAPVAKPQPKLPYKQKTVAPAVKMRALHWSKIDEFAVENTVWNTLNDARVPLDSSEFEGIFCLNKPKAPLTPEEEEKQLQRASAGAAAATPAKEQTVSLLDGQRAQNVAIAIARFRPLSHEALRDAIYALDEKVLPVDKVTAMLKVLPTPEEAEAVQSYDGPLTQLGNPERFFLAIGAVPRLQRRLELFLFKQTFEAELAEAKQRSELCLKVLKVIRESKALKRVLEYVLALGNYLNGGSAKGGAYGFKVAFLPKLSSTKSADNKSNLLLYLVSLLEKDPTNPLALVEELEDLSAAARIEANVLQSGAQKLTRSMKMAESDVKSAKPSEQDRFVPVMSAFVDKCGPLAAAVEADTAQVAEQAAAIAKMFGEEPAAFDMDAIFALFSDFRNQLKEARTQLAKQAAEKERQERLKAAAEERAKAGGSTTAAAAPSAPGAPGAGAAGGPLNMGAIAAAAAARRADRQAAAAAGGAPAPGAGAATGAGAGAGAAGAEAGAAGPSMLKPHDGPTLVLPAPGTSGGHPGGTGRGSVDNSPTAAGAVSAATGDGSGGSGDGAGGGLRKQVGATLRGGNSADILKEINARRAMRSQHQSTRRMFETVRGGAVLVPGGAPQGPPPPPHGSASGSGSGGHPTAPPPPPRGSVLPSHAPPPPRASVVPSLAPPPAGVAPPPPRRH